MVGTTAQIAALTCHLNARIRGLACPVFFPDAKPCTFCESIVFGREQRSLFGLSQSWRTVAKTPDEWMDQQVQEGAERALLVYTSGRDGALPDRVSAAFASGGSRWLLCLERGGRFDCWEGAWDVVNREAADRRIWRVRYTMVAAGMDPPRAPALNDAFSAKLTANLEAIEAFAVRHRLDGFASCFRNARDHLGSTDPKAVAFPEDLAPEGSLSSAAARVLAACQQAWVFGGMGSWNDMGFEGAEQQEYDRLSDELHRLLCDGICAGVNDSATRRE